MKCVDGQVVPEDFHFCPACGVAVPAMIRVPCPRGHMVNEGSAFCGLCGAPREITKELRQQPESPRFGAGIALGAVAVLVGVLLQVGTTMRTLPLKVIAGLSERSETPSVLLRGSLASGTTTCDNSR
jgi:hypothetical protein